MVRVYLSLIQKGLRTIENVPTKYKKEVQKLLNNKE